MKYQFKGSLEVRFPEGHDFVANGDTKEEALSNLLEELLENCDLLNYIKTDYLTTTSIRKVFKVRVTQTFVNEVTVDTDDYPEIEDEDDARRYVEQNFDYFESHYDYDSFTQEDFEIECSSYDTREETVEE